MSEIHRARGEILLRCLPCDTSAAEAAFVRAIDVARSQEAKLSELQSALSLALLWIAGGKHEQACDLLAPICAWFAEDRDCDPLREARALLRDSAAK